MLSTAAEARLVEHLVGILKNRGAENEPPPRILNVGAGHNPSIEQQLAAAGCRFVCDRADVEPCQIDHPFVDRCFHCAVEDMSPVPSEVYGAAFANFVDEISARPAAGKAVALKDRFKFKTEMDDEARRNMFRHLQVTAA